VISLCLLAAAAVALELVSHPHDVASTLAHLPSSATVGEREVVRTGLDAQLLSRAAMLPVQLLIGWSLQAAVAYLLIQALGAGDPPRMKHLMSVFVGAGVIDICERTAEIVHNFIVPAVGSPAAGYPWTLLVLTGPIESYPLSLLLTSINMFTLWTVGAVGWVLSVLCSVHTSKAVLIAGSVRAISAGCTIAMLHLLRNAYVFFP
jgi:hypothetical protein